MKILGILALAVVLAGCGSDQMSPTEEAKLKASLSKGGDPSVMTADQKKAMADYMKKNMGGSAPSKGSAPSAGH